MMQYFGINLLKYLATFILMSDDFRLYNLSNWFKIFILLIELLLNYPTKKTQNQLNQLRSLQKYKVIANLCGNGIQSKCFFSWFAFRGTLDAKTKSPSLSVKWSSFIGRIRTSLCTARVQSLTTLPL